MVFYSQNLYFIKDKLLCGLYFYIVSWNSVFVIANRYKLDDPEIECR